MRASTGLVFLLLGCASQTTPSSSHSVVTRPQEPLIGSPQRPDSAAQFPLPAALSIDPRKIPIPPLEFQVVKPQRATLSNGVGVYLMEDHTVPLVTVRALIEIGTLDDVAGKLGVADLTFELLDAGGAGKLSADALDDLLESRAADVGGGAADEYSLVTLNFRSTDLETLLPIFADMLLRPRFQKDRFEVAVNQYVESVRRRPDSPDGLANRALRKAVYGADSLFAREPTEKSLKAITLEDVRAFHRAGVVPQGTRLLVAGDFDGAKVVKQLEALFGSWKGPPKRTRQLPPAPKRVRRVILVPKDTPQAKIRIGGPGYVRLSPQEYAFRVTNTALGGFGVGRMYREIRGGKGLAYSAYSSVSPGPVEGLFVAGADTQPAKAAQTIEEALRILGEISGKKPLSKQEVGVASDMYLNSFAFRFDSPEKVVLERAVFDLFGYPADYLDTYREKVALVDESAALTAAKALARLDELQIVVVGPPAALGDLSRFGPVVQIADVEAFR